MGIVGMVRKKWVSGKPWEGLPRKRGRRKVVRGEDQPSHSHNEYGGRGLGLGQHEPGLPASRVHPPLCGSISVGSGGYRSKEGRLAISPDNCTLLIHHP